MKKFLLPAFYLPLALAAQEAETSETPKITEAKALERSSLALGYQEGIKARHRQIKAADLNQEAFLKGFLMGLKSEKLPISAEEVREALNILQANLTRREKEEAAKNLVTQQKFLEANLTAPGVTQTVTGLQYRVINPGEGSGFGDSILVNREILVNYRGTLPDGREFITSNAVTPEKLQVEEVVPGFREAVGMMPKGAKWMIYVPSDLAYGSQRRSDLIGPNQLLLFEVELVDVRELSAPETGDEK